MTASSEFAQLCLCSLPPSAEFEVKSAVADDAATRRWSSVLSEGILREDLATSRSSFLASLHTCFLDKRDMLPTMFKEERVAVAMFPTVGDSAALLGLSSEPVRLAGLVSQLRDDTVIAESFRLLKATLSTCKETLLHADLMSNSTFASGTTLIVTASPYTSIGPRSVDLAAMVAEYLLYYFIHMRCEQDNDTHRQHAYKLTELCQAAFSEYMQKTACLPDTDSVLDTMSQVAGFAGCLLAARALSNEKDISEADLATELLEAGLRLLNACRRIKSIGQLIFIGLMLC